MAYVIPLRARDGSIRATAYVDDADRDLVASSRWSVGGSRGQYAKATIDGRRVYLHRLVMGLAPGDGLEVDHIDRDGFNNRRSNLRVVAHAENRQNTSGWRASSSDHRGVAWAPHAKKWLAQAKAGGEKFSRYFEDEDEAAAAVLEWRREHMPFSVEASA
jgi:hypothetical protein